jgi:hypothetical protein
MLALRKKVRVYWSLKATLVFFGLAFNGIGSCFAAESFSVAFSSYGVVEGEAASPRSIIQVTQFDDISLRNVPISLPSGVEGISVANSGLYFVVSSTAEIQGIKFTPRDIGFLSADGDASLAVSSMDLGLESPVKINALHVDEDQYYFTFDSWIDLGVEIYSPTSIVLWNPSEGYDSTFRMEVTGVSGTAKVDSLSRADGGDLLVSFNSSFVSEGVNYTRGDIISLNSDGTLGALEQSLVGIIQGCSGCFPKAFSSGISGGDAIFWDRFES